MVHWTVKVTSPPGVEPFTLEDAKRQLKMDEADDDEKIAALITPVREVAEEMQGRAYITQTLELRMDRFPGREFQLPRPPLQAVNSIKYIDADGAEQIFSAIKYAVDTDSEPGRIRVNSGESWPTLDTVMNAVRIEYIAGYGDSGADVKQRTIQAMYYLLTHYFEHPEWVVLGTIATKIPFTLRTLIALDRMRVRL